MLQWCAQHACSGLSDPAIDPILSKNHNASRPPVVSADDGDDRPKDLSRTVSMHAGRAHGPIPEDTCDKRGSRSVDDPFTQWPW